jgi:putative endonuclease
MPHCYILYSESSSKFYVGFTQTDLEERIAKHNASFYTKSYSGFTNDWILYIDIRCPDNKKALSIEKHIKRMKSKKYIENLKFFPEMIEKLIIEYTST